MDNNLNTTDPIALSLLFNDDLYILEQKEPEIVEKKELLPTQSINISNQEVTQPVKIEITEPVKEVIKPVEEIKPSTKPFYEYLGENNKSFLVIINNTEKDFLAKADLDFLLKIIKAKGLVLDDIAILNKAKYQNLSFDTLKEFFGFNKMLTFGINPKEFGVVGIESNKKFIFKKSSILGTWDLGQLNTDVKKKTTFWNELKNF
jgi:hypothetical protein